MCYFQSDTNKLVILHIYDDPEMPYIEAFVCSCSILSWEVHALTGALLLHSADNITKASSYRLFYTWIT